MTLLFWLSVPALTVIAYAVFFNAWWVHLPAVWLEHRRDCVRCFDLREFSPLVRTTPGDTGTGAPPVERLAARPGTIHKGEE